MSHPDPGPGLARAPEEVVRVTNLELFFDLVFVFAITQLTSVLVRELSVVGLFRVVVIEKLRAGARE
jgi:low temperature requirement protein LtrA